MTHTTIIRMITSPLNRKHSATVIRADNAQTRTAATGPRSRPFIINCSADFLPKQRIEIR